MASPYLLSNPTQALFDTYKLIDDFIIKEADYFLKSGLEFDKSGSCAITALLIEKRCFIAWIGDSRALLSKDCGKQIFQLTSDHKASNPFEQERVREAGGGVIKFISNKVTHQVIIFGGLFQGCLL